MNHLPYIAHLDPYNDDGSDPKPWDLEEAISFACKVLKNPNATQWEKTTAATELQYAFDCMGDDNE
jgi:hypothetical protein